MRRSIATMAALAVATLMLLPACAGRKGPPDPAKVQQKMTATLDGEKELIRSTVFVSVLSGLSTVGGRPAVVEQAALAQSYEEALFFLQAIKMLVGFQASGVEITQLLGPARLPGVLTSDGRFVFLVPVDRILWTEGIAAAATGSFEEVAKGLETTSREVWFRGQASKRCRAEIKRRGWLVRSEVSFSALAQTES